MVETIEIGTEVLGALMQDIVEYFYADGGLVVSTQTEKLQRLFDVLTDLFDQVGLQMIVQKTVSISCWPYHAPVGMLEVAYARWTPGVVPKYRERQRRRVQCPECGLELAVNSLPAHLQIQHGMGRGGSQIYWISIPMILSQLSCPVDGCRGGAKNRTNLRVQFIHCQVWDTIVILD